MFAGPLCKVIGMLLWQVVRHLNRNEKGQAYLEFAVIVPIMMLVVMGIVDFGRVFNTWLVMTHGAREGARVAAVGWDYAAVEERVNDVTAGFDVQVELVPAVSAGSAITVTTSTTVTLLSGWIGAIFGASDIPIGAQGVTRYEGACVIGCP
jgi:Flp pilus assembly protein TadG